MIKETHREGPEMYSYNAHCTEHLLTDRQSMKEAARRFNVGGPSPGAIPELITLINATLTTQTTDGGRKCQTHQRRRGEKRDEESQGAPSHHSSKGYREFASFRTLRGSEAPITKSIRRVSDGDTKMAFLIVH
jgi:hypothetical protein